MRMVVREEKVSERKKGKPGFQGRCVQRRFWQMPSTLMAERMVQITFTDDGMDEVEIYHVGMRRCGGGGKQVTDVRERFLRVRKEWRGGGGAMESCDSDSLTHACGKSQRRCLLFHFLNDFTVT